jgi:hypothetical protein
MMQNEVEEEIVHITLPKLSPAQRAVADDKSRFKVWMAGRQIGKTTLCKYLVIKQLINDGKVIYITPTFKLAKEIYDELLSWLPPEIIEISNKSDHKIKLKERYGNGTIQFFSGQKEHQDTVRGFTKVTLVIYDEAAYIPDLLEFHTRRVSSLMLAKKADCIWISTPFGRNDFNALYQKALAGFDNYAAFHNTTYDNPYLDPSEIERERLDKSDAAFREENLAVPGENQYNPFGIDAITRNTISTLSNNPVVVYGVDVSAGKKDWSVVVGLDVDSKLAYFDRWRADWSTTLSRVQSLPNGNSILKVVDATGTGSKFSDDVIRSMNNVIGFTFTSKSKPEIMLNIIKAVQQDKVKINQTIADEMAVFEYKINPKTQHIEFNAQSGFHDDGICALAMAYHHIPKQTGNFLSSFSF